MVFDYYFVIVPVFILFGLLNLIVLKLALKANKIVQSKKQNEQSQKTQLTLLNGITFILKSRTLLQFCFIRRAKNKLPMLLTISLLGIINYIFPVLFAYCFIGTFVSVTYLASEILCTEQQQQMNSKQSVKPNAKTSISYIIYGLTSSIIFISIAVWSFMNYHNTFLSNFTICLMANVGMDFLIVQPIVLLGLSIVLSKIQRFKLYVSLQIKALYLLPLQESQQQDLGAVGFSPKKKTNSPSKIPKIFAKKKIHLNIHEQLRQTETFQLALQMSKKIKKNRSQLPPIAPLSSSMDLQNILKEKSKYNDPHTPINQINSRDKTIKGDKDYLQSSEMDLKGGDRMNTPVNRKLTQFSNEQPSLTPNSKSKLKNKTLDVNITSAHKRDKNQQIDQYDIVQHTIQGQNFFKNGRKQFSVMKKFNFSDEEVQDQQDDKCYRRKDASIENQRESQKVSLLKILQNASGEMQEIDGNSPQKHRKRLGPIKQQFMMETEINKKPHRKSSSKKNNRVIKFTSGSPYLQYLPKMLQKQYERNHKKSQPIVSRQDISIIQERKRRKSVRKLKNTKQPIGSENNQNDCPQFVVEDF